jgi:hypothetical protein
MVQNSVTLCNSQHELILYKLREATKPQVIAHHISHAAVGVAISIISGAIQ